MNKYHIFAVKLGLYYYYTAIARVGTSAVRAHLWLFLDNRYFSNPSIYDITQMIPIYSI